MGDDRPDNFRDIGEALEQLQQHLVTLDGLIKRKVLPNQRYRLFKEVQDANTLAEQMRELLKRSGMIHRLGFVQQGKEVQPVMVGAPERVNQPDAIATEGTGVSVG